MLRRVRHIILIILMAALLVPAAPRAAYAIDPFTLAASHLIAGIKAIVGYMAAVSATVQSIIAPQSENMNKRIKHKSTEKIALEKEMAKARAVKEKHKAKVALPNMVPPERNMCRAVTTAGRLSAAAISAATSTVQAEQLRLDARRGPFARGGGDDTGAVSTRDGVAKADTTLCPYTADPDMVAKCQAAQGGSPPPGVPAPGSLALGDVMATTLLSTLAFDSAQHEQAASTFCDNIMGNLKPDTLRGNSIYQNVNSINQFNASMASEAMLALAGQICTQSWQLRKPDGGSGYAALTGDPLDEGDCEQTTGEGSSQTAAPSARPNNANTWVYCRLRQVGWRDGAGVLAASYQWLPTTPSMHAQMLFNARNAPSVLQLRESIVVQPQQDEFLRGTAGRPENATRNLLIAKSITLRQRFYEYQNLEKQMLLSAIQLARKVRARQGNS
jgi:hypothetical protein